MTFDPMFNVQSQIQAVSRELADADFDPASNEPREDHAAHASGQTCARCHESIEETQAVRRRLSGDWVHEQCPSPSPAPPA